MTIVSPQSSLVLNHLCHRQQYVYAPPGQITIVLGQCTNKAKTKIGDGEKPKQTNELTNNLILKMCSIHKNSKL